MAYNLIEFTERSIVSIALKRIWAVAAILVALIVAASVWLQVLNKEKQLQLKKLSGDQQGIETQIEQLAQHNENLKQLASRYQTIEDANALLAQQLRDFLDLVPDSTTLSYFKWQNGQLHLNGVTTNAKETQTALIDTLSKQFTLKKVRWDKRRQTFWLIFDTREGGA